MSMQSLIASLPLGQVPDVIQKQDDEIKRLRTLNEEMVAVLNGARICLKNRDQNSDEALVLAAIVSVLSRAEPAIAG